MTEKVLPVVDPEVMSSFVADSAENPDIFRDEYFRILEEQPHLTGIIASFILEMARDDTEAGRAYARCVYVNVQKRKSAGRNRHTIKSSYNSCNRRVA